MLVEVNHGGGGDRVRSVQDPLGTVTAKRGVGLATPTATPAHDSIDPRRIEQIGAVPHLLGIRFRMLTNRELARAMGFDDDEAEYEFTGNV